MSNVSPLPVLKAAPADALAAYDILRAAMPASAEEIAAAAAAMAQQSPEEIERFVTEALTRTGKTKTALQDAALRAEKAENTDVLTGMPNRHHFKLVFDKAVAELKRHSKSQTAILFIDLDKFSAINNTYGHIAGDRAIQAVADRLKTVIRKNEIAARWGGDEFVILLNNRENRRNFHQSALKRLRDHLQDLAIEHEGSCIDIYASVGAVVVKDTDLPHYEAVARQTGQTLEEAVKHEADQAMYRDKESRKSLRDAMEKKLKKKQGQVKSAKAKSGLPSLLHACA